jgi:hypothetical protein
VSGHSVGGRGGDGWTSATVWSAQCVTDTESNKTHVFACLLLTNIEITVNDLSTTVGRLGQAGCQCQQTLRPGAGPATLVS